MAARGGEATRAMRLPQLAIAAPGGADFPARDGGRSPPERHYHRNGNRRKCSSGSGESGLMLGGTEPPTE